MRQSAMRAYVAAMAEEPVPPVPPPPPPVTTWHVSLSAVDAGTGTLLSATTSLQEYSGHDPAVPGGKVQANYSISADIQPDNWVRARSTWVFDGRGLSAFVVDGVVKEAQTEPDVWSTMYVDVTPDSDRTEILAVYG